MLKRVEDMIIIGMFPERTAKLRRFVNYAGTTSLAKLLHRPPEHSN